MNGRNEIPSGDSDAPTVLLEPCVAFVADDREPGVCGACGWLDHEHAVTPPIAEAARRAA